jgi:hypothetical protein
MRGNQEGLQSRKIKGEEERRWSNCFTGSGASIFAETYTFDDVCVIKMPEKLRSKK